MHRAWVQAPRARYRPEILLLCAALAGCEGFLQEPSGPSEQGVQGADGTPDDVGESPTCAEQEADPGPAPLRLLSRDQYLHTVRDLVGEVPGLTELMASAPVPSTLGVVHADVSQVELELYQRAAELVAAHVVTSAGVLERLSPCAGDSEPRGCARAFVQGFGARAYRAPLEGDADLERHLTLYDAGASADHARGMELLLRGMLQAPRFLYRVELGTDRRVGERAVRLAPREIATRLSYLVWDTLPDERLLRAADEGELDDDDGVLAQLERMLDDARGRGMLTRFLGAWTHADTVDDLVKDEAMFPEWQRPELKAALGEQAARFFDHVLQAEDGALSALLTTPTVFASAALSDYYEGATGSSLQTLSLEGRASGLLTLPSLLARLAKPDESSPIYRGKFVRESLLCLPLPTPPGDIPMPPEVQEGVSTRERLRQHEVDPACSGCHRLMDPIGFAFEHFDALGRYRSHDGEQPVDASGELFMAGDLSGKVNGVVELGQKLAASPEVEECVARQWFRFALTRTESKVDECTLDRLVSAFRAEGSSLHALPRALVVSDAFLTIRARDREVSP